MFPSKSALTLWAVFLAAALLLCVNIVLAASIGEMRIPFMVTLQSIAHGLGVSDVSLDPIQQGIIWQYRMSRALIAAFSGAGLALCGVVLQALLRNALAEPYVLGVSAGASTGAVSVMLLGVGGGAIGVSAGAFLGALMAFAVVMFLASGVRRGVTRVILAGVAAAQLFNAITAWLVSTSANAEQSRSIMFWLLGSLGGVRWPDVELAAIVVSAGFVLCFYFARTMDAFAFGEDAAASLGVSVRGVRAVLLILTALITATLVSIVGAVGFVGLVIPHAARFLIGPGHVRLLPATALIGANFMVLSDIVSRVIVAQQTLPIGVVTALFGAPAFALILYRVRTEE
ncbi:FecCD family ABC transporter permease [Larsenimonas suaedae]|uniref:Iron ABC transporter permease n=1 Tax=Larsenimonas suaedae TaxID=1851019 RepID=A0ABU1GWP4_9GAMM|nr:iron ABC transporter permease [Larsenimonas suaedae]MCM2971258.1 iron ABC transporter permease [Larsenimonas suaedae]MDR5895967.1 iron ABC transporter permease [Larsenimonas suaedae]